MHVIKIKWNIIVEMENWNIEQQQQKMLHQLIHFLFELENIFIWIDWKINVSKQCGLCFEIVNKKFVMLKLLVWLNDQH